MKYLFHLFQEQLPRVILQKFRQIHRKALVLEPLFNKIAGMRPSTLLKRDSETGVFLWIFEIFKNTLFTEHLQVTTSLVFLNTFSTETMYSRIDQV